MPMRAIDTDLQRPIVRRISDWTLKEHEVVVSHWPDTKTIARKLPHRSEGSIHRFAARCNLTKQLHHWTGAQDAILKRRVREGIKRKAIAEELGLTLIQVANRMQYTNTRYAKKQRAPTGNIRFDSVAQRAFELNMSLREVDEACGSGAAFQRYGKGRTIALKHFAKAVELLDGELCVRWNSLDSD